VPDINSNPGGWGAQRPAALPPACLIAAFDYTRRGWPVFPIQPGSKKPFVKWKPFQGQLPSESELLDWWDQWPDAGVAIALGPFSGILVVDVDGQAAHAELLRRLGSLPTTPVVKSGNPDPDRFHLFFKHPAGLETRAKATPWHPQLEFRGHGGYVVLPPSLHKSGQRYAWMPGQSLEDCPLASVPDLIIESLRTEDRRRRPSATSKSLRTWKGDGLRIGLLHGISNATRAFLSGRYSDGPQWNDRLFRAACDLAGSGYAEDHAISLLLAGANPWSTDEERNTMATIRSAFGMPRQPAWATCGVRLGRRPKQRGRIVWRRERE
jgi:hypothetical protein